MGLLNYNPEAFLKRAQADDNVVLEQRIAERRLAIQEGRFSDAERIRSDLADGGVVLQDEPDGNTSWRRMVTVSFNLPLEFNSPTPVGERTTRIEALIDKRALARKERRFSDADRIRAELAAEGVILEDKPDGTTDWRRA